MFQGMSNMEIIKLLLPLVIFEVCLMAFCLYRLTKDKVKFLPKWAWALIIIFINLVGPIFYLLIGRERD
ncbi:PLD nuclease N-terminal domain-containing protein [Candidatus Clostridium stratigraminis]|uniref:PLD nuclease N-terminal domain-containing protein n=1 Tax=Candidatus Clostridium stratigraminis TaxID=3381661 RepID=A0ABW8T2Z8_9CLOT